MPWWQRKARDTRIVVTGNGEPWLTMVACTLFHSYLRLHARVETIPRFGEGAVSASADAAVIIHFDGNAPSQQSKCTRLDDGRAHEIELEALVDPAGFPGNGVPEITLGNQVSISPLVRLAGFAVFHEFRSLFEPLKAEIAAWIAAHGPARPSMLDIGGRARSGHQLGERFPECDVATFDIVPDPGVQVVGDAHDMGRHFAPASFDFVHCASVFEHLVMPWKVALEINRVLKPGGVAYIFTHQTTGLHDMPWDFFRFSDAAWSGLFNRFTGFEVVQSEMSNTMHIVPRAWSEHYRGNENAGGFESSSVIVRKTGDARVAWEVPVEHILATAYPQR
jgi:SAM-dependent methyltransferase